jgi:hypothetical protein
MAQFVQKNGLEIILRLFVQKSKTLDSLISEYTHPNIFWTTFLELESQNKSILKKSDVTHVPGDFPEKRPSAFRQTDGHQGFGPGMPKKKKFFFFLYYYFKKLFFIFCDYFLIYKRFATSDISKEIDREAKEFFF